MQKRNSLVEGSIERGELIFGLQSATKTRRSPTLQRMTWNLPKLVVVHGSMMAASETGWAAAGLGESKKMGTGTVALKGGEMVTQMTVDQSGGGTDLLTAITD